MSASTGNEQRVKKWPWRGLTIMWACLAVCSSIPYLVGWAATPSHQTYVGRIISAPGDVAAYYSDMEQAAHGQLLFKNNFTAGPQQARLFEPIWLIGGWLMALAHASPALIYHLMRVAAIFPLLMVLWVWVKKMTGSTRQRWMTIIIAASASGLGWISLSFPHLPLGFDAWVAESNTFLSMTHSALFLLSQALLAWLVMWVWEIVAEGRAVGWWGFWAAALAINHPYDIITLGAVTIAILLLRGWRFPTRTRRVLLSGLWLLPVALYYGWALREPALSGWTQQNVDLSRSFWGVVIGYGLLWVLAGIGGLILRKQKNAIVSVGGIWVVVGIVLVYIPFIHFQRRLSSGLDIPIGLLAGFTVAFFVERIAKKIWQPIIFILVVLGLSLTNVSIVGVTSRNLFRGQPPYPASISADEENVIQAIQKNVPDGQAILSDIWIGNDIAGLTTKTVVLGHGQQTIGVVKKGAEWNAFLSQETTPNQRQAIVTKLDARWLVWRPGLDNQGYSPNTDSSWQVVDRTATMVLYRRQ